MVIEIGVYNKVVIYVFLIIRLLFYAHRLYLYIPRENLFETKKIERHSGSFSKIFFIPYLTMEDSLLDIFGGARKVRSR